MELNIKQPKEIEGIRRDNEAELLDRTFLAKESLIDKIIKEAESCYRTKGRIPEKLYFDQITYADFIKEIHKKYPYFFAMPCDGEPLQFHSMDIIKIKGWRIE